MTRFVRLGWLAAVLLLAFTSGPARADVESDKRAAGDTSLADAERLAACTRLIENPGLPPAEKAIALRQRARLHMSARHYPLAAADFEQSLTLDPDNPPVLRDLGVTKFHLRKFDAALADLTRASTLDPRDYWTWYVRGMCNVQLGKNAEALEDYAHSLSQNSRAYAVLQARARLYLSMKETEKAIADADTAVSLNHRAGSGFFLRGRGNELAGRREAAFRDLAIAAALDPNLVDAEEAAARVAPSAGPGPRGPIAWGAPKPKGKITYLSTRTKPEPPQDSMEKAIGELMGWFATKPKPGPIETNFMRREFLSEKDGVVKIKPSFLYESRNETPSADEADLVYAFWPRQIPFAGQTVLNLDYDSMAMASLWPLEPGKSASGKAELTYTAPAKPTQLSQAMSLKPGQKGKLGSFSWKATVVGWEPVVVPAGAFDALVIRDEQELEIPILGQAKKMGSVVRHWYVPGLSWWVKRARELNGEVMTDVAVEIAFP